MVDAAPVEVVLDSAIKVEFSEVLNNGARIGER